MMYKCSWCDKPTPTVRGVERLCESCYKAYIREKERLKYRRYVAMLAANAIESYQNWKHSIEQIPTDYHTLTEDEWLKVCRYFDGMCAVCSKPDIDSRGYFIPFSEGGRYCNWNVIPLCEECASRSIRQPNAWRTMNIKINGDLPKQRTKELARITGYLQPIIEEALNGAK